MFGVDNICHRVWLGQRELAGGQSFQKSLQEEVSFSELWRMRII